MDKLSRYTRERNNMLYCLRNERRLTSKQIAEETNLKLYTVRKHLRVLLENKIIEKETNWESQFAYTWLYKKRVE